jgi:hypothetical protein
MQGPQLNDVVFINRIPAKNPVGIGPHPKRGTLAAGMPNQASARIRPFGVFEAPPFRGGIELPCEPEGGPEVRIGDSVVMLADGGEGWPPVPTYVHIYVPDVDATYALALRAGGTSVQEPVKKQDEDKRGGVKDPGGTTWWIATKVE